MSPRFWEVFGYDPSEKTHKAAEWQDMIHPDDLTVALENFNKHCADASHPYDQIVRYKHRDGSTVWVRCRGIVIRDDDGNPMRMLGAHNEITTQKRTERQLERRVGELATFNKLAVGREQRMIDLKREVNALLVECGRTPKYDLTFADGANV